jgi:hypothetical protein
MSSSFIESVPPDITESIPTPISARLTSVVYVNSKTRADVAIDDMPFRYAIDDQNVYQRETADFKRQQIDTSREPGEQTLNQWWVRDQNSWHRGAGINFYEPGSNPTNTSQYSDNITEFRYARSMGVNPWLEGSASLHHSTTAVVTATSGQACYATSANVSGVASFFGVVGGALFRHDGTTRINYSGTGFIFNPVITGAKVLVGSTAGIYSGDVTGTTTAALWTTGSGVPVQPWWVKSRIIAAQGPKLWDVTLAGGNLDSTTPLYTHPSTTWTWTGISEAPGAILASGYDNGYGYIYAFRLTDAGTGASPTLGSPFQVSDFPPGEEVHSLKSYLGQYVAIGTSRGVRVGTIDSSGNIQYGPLTIECTQPVRALSARDRFVYAGIENDLDGKSGLARIDLSQGIVDLRFAWAYDLQSHASGQVRAVTFLGLTDRAIAGVTGAGFYLQSATAYEQTGYLTSGRIRYGTAEPKAFNLVKIRAAIPADCTIGLSTIDQGDNEVFLTSLGDTWNTDQDLTLRSLSDVGQAYVSIKLTLGSDDAHLSTPVLQSLQVKATPLPRIQRNIKLPLRLEDVEQDRNGIKVGRAGSANVRLQMLEDMEQARSIVLVHDYTSGEAFTAQIQKVQFIRDTPPSRNRGNFGGIVNLTVLKL